MELRQSQPGMPINMTPLNITSNITSMNLPRLHTPMNIATMNLVPMNLVPMVIDQGDHWDRAYDLYSLLLKNRIVFLGQPVEAQMANVIVAQLLYLEREG